MKTTFLSSKKMIVILAIIMTLILSSCNLEKTNTIKDNSNQVETSNDSDWKFKAVENEIHMMKNNWMINVSKLYTDLTFIKSVDKSSDEIVAWMWDEDWFYSSNYDTTVIVCKSMNTPAHIFKWKEISKDEIIKVREMKKKMMEEMMWSWNMMMWWEHNMEMKKDEMVMKSGEYTTYSPEAVKNAKWKIILFFYADWCPSCKATDKDILWKKVPEDLTILKVNFDNSSELKQKYEVLSQTTFVQIDKDWKEITKWVWWDLEDIISSVK